MSLTGKGHQTDHVADIGLLAATDQVFWDFALEHGAAILTKDEDFAVRIALHPEGPSIVWIRLGNAGNRVLLGWFEPLLPYLEKALSSGEKLIEMV